MSTKFTWETKESVLKMSVKRSHSVNEGNLDTTSVYQAHLGAKGFLQVCSVNQASIG